MSYYDQRGQVPHRYTDTSQPLLPYPLAGFGNAALGIDTSTIPVVASLPPVPVPPDPGGTLTLGLYAPPGVELSVNDPQTMIALAALQDQRYVPVNNRLCALQPAPSGTGSALKDIIQGWSAAGLFVVIAKTDALCPANLYGGGAGGGAVYGVGIDYIKNLLGRPGWSVLATPGGAPSTKANWDAWFASASKDPLQAKMSPGAMTVVALVAVGGVLVLSGVFKPKPFVPNRRHRR